MIQPIKAHPTSGSEAQPLVPGRARFHDLWRSVWHACCPDCVTSLVNQASQPGPASPLTVNNITTMLSHVPSKGLKLFWAITQLPGVIAQYPRLTCNLPSALTAGAHYGEPIANLSDPTSQQKGFFYALNGCAYNYSRLDPVPTTMTHDAANHSVWLMPSVVRAHLSANELARITSRLVAEGYGSFARLEGQAALPEPIRRVLGDSDFGRCQPHGLCTWSPACTRDLWSSNAPECELFFCAGNNATSIKSFTKWPSRGEQWLSARRLSAALQEEALSLGEGFSAKYVMAFLGVLVCLAGLGFAVYRVKKHSPLTSISAISAGPVAAIETVRLV